MCRLTSKYLGALVVARDVLPVVDRGAGQSVSYRLEASSAEPNFSGCDRFADSQLHDASATVEASLA